VSHWNLRGGKSAGQILAHTDGLRALTREQQSGLAHKVRAVNTTGGALQSRKPANGRTGAQLSCWQPAAFVAVLPHPSPLPLGEGATHTAFRRQERHSNSSTDCLPPLSQWESNGIGSQAGCGTRSRRMWITALPCPAPRSAASIRRCMCRTMTRSACAATRRRGCSRREADGKPSAFSLG
jgi:hypothetical protein